MIRPAIAILLAVSFTFVNPCSQESKTRKPKADEPVYNVTVIYPKFISVPKKYHVTGTFDVGEVNYVTAHVDGRIEQVYVSEGDNVVKDDPLVTISNKSLLEKIDIKRARIKEYQAKLAELQVRVEVNEGEDRPVSIEDTDFLDEEVIEDDPQPKQYGDTSTQKNPKTVKALVEYIEKAIEVRQKEADALDRALLSLSRQSPVSGMVTKIFVTEGNKVGTKDKLIEVSQTDPMSINFALPQETASYIDKRSNVKVSPVDAKSVTGEGTVNYIDANVDTKTNKIGVKAYVSNEEGRLKGGQKADVFVSTRKMGRVVVLPKRVLFYDDDKSYVYIVLRNQAKQVEVSLGDEMEGGNLQIHGDLRVDDPIIIDRPVELEHNSFVKMKEQGPALKEKE